MSEFNAIKAQFEQIEGMQQVYSLLTARCARTERVLAEAEAEHNAMVKMAAFMRELLDRARAELRRLQDEKEKEAAT